MESSSTARNRRSNRVAGKRRSGRNYTTVFDGEKWIVVQSRPRTPTRMPLRAIATALVVMFLTKGAVLAYLGPEGHRSRMIAMASDNFFYQAQAWVMRVDPISNFVAAQLRSLMR